MEYSDDSKAILEGISVNDIPDDLSESGIKNAECDITSAEKLVLEDTQEIGSLFNESYIRMDDKFVDYLEVFTRITEEGDKVKRKLKVCFFWCIMVILGLLVIAQCVVCVIAALKGNMNSHMVISICGILIQNLTAIIILPKIIAEYLFNKKEEKNRIDIIKAMQAYNEHKKKHG